MPASAYLQKFTGQYYSPQLDYHCRILLHVSGRLILRRPTLSDKVLEPLGKNRFLFEMEHRNNRWYATASFSTKENGDVNRIGLQHSRMLQHHIDKVR